jgi:peroxiredoxin
MAGAAQSMTAAAAPPKMALLMKAIIAALGALAIGAFAAFLLTPPPLAPQARFPELQGKVAVVSFWATWCPECVKETPRMVEAHRRFAPRGYETIAVAVRDQPARVQEFASRRALPYKVVMDLDGSIAREFGNVRVTPTTFVIGRDGRVLRRYVGEPNWQEFDRLVERALAAQ